MSDMGTHYQYDRRPHQTPATPHSLSHPASKAQMHMGKTGAPQGLPAAAPSATPTVTLTAKATAAPIHAAPQEPTAIQSSSTSASYDVVSYEHVSVTRGSVVAEDLKGYNSIAVPISKESFLINKRSDHTLYLWVPDTLNPVHFKNESQTAMVEAGGKPYKIEHENFANELDASNRIAIDKALVKIVETKAAQKSKNIRKETIMDLIKGNYGIVPVTTTVTKLDVTATQNMMRKHAVGFLVYEDDKDASPDGLDQRIKKFLAERAIGVVDQKFQNSVFHDTRNFTGQMRFQLMNKANGGNIEKTDVHRHISGHLLVHAEDSGDYQSDAFVMNATKRKDQPTKKDIENAGDDSISVDLHDMCLMWALFNIETVFDSYKDLAKKHGGDAHGDMLNAEIAVLEKKFSAIGSSEASSGVQIGLVLKELSVFFSNILSFSGHPFKISESYDTNKKKHYTLSVPKLFYYAAGDIFYAEVEKTQMLNKGGDIYLLAIPLPLDQVRKKLEPYESPADFLQNFTEYDDSNTTAVQTVDLDVKLYRQAVIYMMMDNELTS